MEDLNLAWLAPVLLQVIGIAIGLSALGIAYDRAIRRKISIVNELEQGYEVRWLAYAGIIFAIGLCFSQAFWLFKAIAVVLAILFIVLAWTSRRNNTIEVSNQTKPNPTGSSGR